MKPVRPELYYHPQDKKALNALKSIPGFDKILKFYIKNFSEKLLHQMNMASNLRLGPNQLPDIYNLLPPICQTLGIEEPELYLELDPDINACTNGDTRVFIKLTSGLIESCTENEIKSVIAHECGHIACRHVLYHTLAESILNGGSSFLSDFVTTPLRIALLYWQRCSEFSCDRAAAICMQGSDDVINTMMRFSGAGKKLLDSVNRDVYLSQAEDFEAFVNDNAWNKVMQYFLIMLENHPFAAVRASEIKKWCDSSDFKNIVSYMNESGGIVSSQKKCPNCGTAVESDWKFCKNCGQKL